MMAGKGVGADGGLRGQSARSWAGGLDLLACSALAGLACLGATLLPAGSMLRLVLALVVLAVVPGYLLIEAAAGPAKSAASRARRTGLAFGVSPAVVGLLALATSGLPGGFRPASIVLLVGVTCLALAGAALWRRKAHVRQPVARPAVA